MTYLKPITILEEDASQWWDCVFIEKAGKLCYDHYYDTFPFKEGSTITLSQFLAQIEEELKQQIADTPQGDTLTITGKWREMKPLRWVCQRSSSAGSAFSAENNSRLNVEFVEGRLYHLSEGDILRKPTDSPITIYLPQDEATLDTIAYDDVTWREMEGCEVGSFEVGNESFKVLEL